MPRNQRRISKRTRVRRRNTQRSRKVQEGGSSPLYKIESLRDYLQKSYSPGFPEDKFCNYLNHNEIGLITLKKRGSFGMGNATGQIVYRDNKGKGYSVTYDYVNTRIKNTSISGTDKEAVKSILGLVGIQYFDPQVKLVSREEMTDRIDSGYMGGANYPQNIHDAIQRSHYQLFETEPTQKGYTYFLKKGDNVQLHYKKPYTIKSKNSKGVDSDIIYLDIQNSQDASRRFEIRGLEETYNPHFTNFGLINQQLLQRLSLKVQGLGRFKSASVPSPLKKSKARIFESCTDINIDNLSNVMTDTSPPGGQVRVRMPTSHRGDLRVRLASQRGQENTGYMDVSAYPPGQHSGYMDVSSNPNEGGYMDVSAYPPGQHSGYMDVSSGQRQGGKRRQDRSSSSDPQSIECPESFIFHKDTALKNHPPEDCMIFYNNRIVFRRKGKRSEPPNETPVDISSLSLPNYRVLKRGIKKKFEIVTLTKAQILDLNNKLNRPDYVPVSQHQVQKQTIYNSSISNEVSASPSNNIYSAPNRGDPNPARLNRDPMPLPQGPHYDTAEPEITPGSPASYAEIEPIDYNLENDPRAQEDEFSTGGYNFKNAVPEEQDMNARFQSYFTMNPDGEDNVRLYQMGPGALRPNQQHPSQHPRSQQPRSQHNNNSNTPYSMVIPFRSQSQIGNYPSEVEPDIDSQQQPQQRFQKKPPPSLFKNMTPTTANPFGQASANPFGQASANPFGKARANPFGKARANPFGQASANPFGKASANPFGQASANQFQQSLQSGEGQYRIRVTGGGRKRTQRKRRKNKRKQRTRRN